MPTGWSRDLLELDRRQPAARAPKPLSCKHNRGKFRESAWNISENTWKVKVVTQTLTRSDGKDPIIPETKKIYNLKLKLDSPLELCVLSQFHYEVISPVVYR